MDTRYAIYYAPSKDSRIWKLGSDWLGRDAYTGEVTKRPQLSGLCDLDLDRLTQSPRLYGFHATMKAPFRLVEGQTEAELLTAAQSFADKQITFSSQMKPLSIGGFIALIITDDTSNITSLHKACVKDFEPFRAPLTDADIARRRKADLSPEQDKRMLLWGYPYIFEDFRFHMTLSGRIKSDETRDRVVSALQTYFADELATPHKFDGMAVYKQTDKDMPFNILGRFGFKN